METPVINIRSAHVGDAESLARLASQLGYPASGDDLRGRLELLAHRSGHEVFVAQGGAEVVGWLHVLCDMHLESGEFAEIAGLVVDENFRGRGVGKALMAAAEEWVRRQGLPSIRLRTNVVRKEAHAFYERTGYSLRKTQRVYEKTL